MDRPTWYFWLELSAFNVLLICLISRAGKNVAGSARRSGQPGVNTGPCPRLRSVKVASSSDRDAFIKFPWRIYRDDPAWVPPLILERKQFLIGRNIRSTCTGTPPCSWRTGPARSWAESWPATTRTIIRSTEQVSAVSAFLIVLTIAKWRARCLPRPKTGLRKRAATEIMGPIDYSTNYMCGLLIDGFQHPPTLLTAHNPPYYAGLIEACGSQKRRIGIALVVFRISCAGTAIAKDCARTCWQTRRDNSPG